MKRAVLVTAAPHLVSCQTEALLLWALYLAPMTVAIGYFAAAEMSRGRGKNFKFANDLYTYGFTFKINREKVLNVFLETGKDEDGMDKYVMHFKIEPKM
ncbi:unnamed protein product [Caenorhabditis nigoni]